MNGSAYLKAGSSSGSITLPESSFSSAGAYTIKVRAKDKAGNYSALKTLTYYYDKKVADSDMPEITNVQFRNTTATSPDISIRSSREDGSKVTVSKVYYYMAATTSTTEPTDDQYQLAANVTTDGDKYYRKQNS